MRNLKIGDIVKVKLLKNVKYGKHDGQNATIPIGTVGKIINFSEKRLNFKKSQNQKTIEVVFFIKNNKWKGNGYWLDKNAEYQNTGCQLIWKIKHLFQRKELILANQKDIGRFNELENDFMSIKMAKEM